MNKITESLNILAIKDKDEAPTNNLILYLRNFYRQNFKKYTLIRKLLILGYFSFFLPSRMWFNHVLKGSERRYAMRWKQLTPLKAFTIKRGLEVDRLVAETEIESITPSVFPLEDTHHLVAASRKYSFPEIYIVAINDATVFGGSNFTCSDNQLIHHDLYNFNNDYTSDELHGRITIDPEKNRARWLLYDDDPVVFDEAASFVDATAGNYSHWLTEVLPRIVLFCSEERYLNVPIIINDGLHENIMQSLLLIVGTARVVITLPFGRELRVRKLFVTSVTGYVPFDKRAHMSAVHSHDGIFSSQALNLVKDIVFSKLPKNRNVKHYPDKILLVRSNLSRSVRNFKEIQTLMLARGYEAVDPGCLTFDQQVKIFNKAKVIVSPTGGSLASTIFCSSKAQVVVLMGKHENMIFRYWAEILKFNSVGVNYVLGDIIGDESLGIHGDYLINTNDMLDMLEGVENK